MILKDLTVLADIIIDIRHLGQRINNLSSDVRDVSFSEQEHDNIEKLEIAIKLIDDAHAVLTGIKS